MLPWLAAIAVICATGAAAAAPRGSTADTGRRKAYTAIVAGGGVPLKNAAGQIAGAVSVSGALEGKDPVCAQAGLDRIAPCLKSRGLK